MNDDTAQKLISLEHQIKQVLANQKYLEGLLFAVANHSLSEATMKTINVMAEDARSKALRNS